MVDKETSRTWSWFLELLKHSLDLKDGDGGTFISDMEKVSNFNFFYFQLFFCQFQFFHNCCFMNLQGLIDAKNDVVPEARNRFCARHIEVNWYKKWKSRQVNKLILWCAWATIHI